MLSKGLVGIAVHVVTPNRGARKNVFPPLKLIEGALRESFIVTGASAIKGN